MLSFLFALDSRVCVCIYVYVCMSVVHINETERQSNSRLWKYSYRKVHLLYFDKVNLIRGYIIYLESVVFCSHSYFAATCFILRIFQGIYNENGEVCLDDELWVSLWLRREID